MRGWAGQKADINLVVTTTPGVQPTANCFMSNGCSETIVKPLKRQNSRLHLWHEPSNFLTEASVLQKFKCVILCGTGSSVGIGTELRAGRSGDRIPVGANFSAPVQTGPGTHPASCTMGTGSFPRVKCGRGVLLTTHPLLASRSWKSRAITLPTLWATPGL
jgi:hypothetical protein